MISIFSWILVSVALFIVFILLLFFGIRKKRKPYIYFSVLSFLSGLGVVIWTLIMVGSKGYQAVSKIDIKSPFRPRTGMEIYTALLGSPATPCVVVLNKMDQVVPRLDCCIWLQFKTCPAEIKRILSLDRFTTPERTRDTSLYLPGYSPRPEWFDPRTLGDSLHIAEVYKPEDPNRHKIFYFSMDSTRAFYCDMAD